jgi:hypothetical protein
VISSIQPLSIDRTLVDGGGGIAAYSTTVQITNSVIANQTGSAFQLPSFAEGGPGHVSAHFTTVINSPVRCPVNGGSITVVDSIILNQASGAPADTVMGQGCTVRYTTVFPQSTALSGDHDDLGIDPLLKDPAHGDYHPTTTSPVIDTASESGTPDFDGTPRPQGAQSDRGAFELAR